MAKQQEMGEPVALYVLFRDESGRIKVVGMEGALDRPCEAAEALERKAEELRAGAS